MVTEKYNVVNNTTDVRFEVETETAKAYLVYRIYGDDLALMHTCVPKQLEGKGVDTELAREAFRYARSHKKLVVNFCPYVAVFIKRHPEFHGQLDPKFLS